MLLLFVLVLITGFAMLNWTAFTTPATLSLGLTEVQAPLGLVMLGVVAILAAIFLTFIVYFQTGMLLDLRRNARDLQASRELAEKAEASRLAELRTLVETVAQQQVRGAQEAHASLLARLGEIERDSRAALEQTGNTLVAYIGELEDRLERGALAGSKIA
jgi:hypothetical protein